jgi:hypothetical protein
VLRSPLMPTDHIIALLVAERDKFNRAIEALQGPIKRRGRPPKSPVAAAAAGQVAPVAPVPVVTAKKRTVLSAVARKAQSQRMKAYWAAKRKKPGGK